MVLFLAASWNPQTGVFVPLHSELLEAKHNEDADVNSGRGWRDKDYQVLGFQSFIFDLIQKTDGEMADG